MIEGLSLFGIEWSPIHSIVNLTNTANIDVLNIFFTFEIWIKLKNKFIKNPSWTLQVDLIRLLLSTWNFAKRAICFADVFSLFLLSVF